MLTTSFKQHRNVNAKTSIVCDGRVAITKKCFECSRIKKNTKTIETIFLFLQSGFLRSVVGPPRSIDTVARNSPPVECAHSWRKFMEQSNSKPCSDVRLRHHWNLAHVFAWRPEQRWLKLGTASLQIFVSMIHLHGGWLLWVMICGVQCFLIS